MMDLRLPGTNGTDVIITIRGELPDARVIMLSTSARFPAAGRVALKDRVNAISLAQTADFRRDSDLFLEYTERKSISAPGRQSSMRGCGDADTGCDRP